MITNIWNKIHFYCGNHHKPIPFIVQAGIDSNLGKQSDFYACEKYEEKNREIGEAPCANRLNFVDAENIVKEISKRLLDAEFNCIELDLTSVQFHIKGIDVKIIKHTSETIDVAILNRKVFK